MKSPVFFEQFSPIKWFANGVVAFPERWQTPVITEKHAFDCMLGIKPNPSFLYVGFPWATLIDGLKNGLDDVDQIICTLNYLKECCKGSTRVVTTAQHIYLLDFIDILKACGVTDICWSHKIKSLEEYNGIFFHPFPLYPAQTADLFIGGSLEINDHFDQAPRKYLANFIGAYNPQIYLTDVRQHILADVGKYADILIVKRNAWHFDRAVYQEQMQKTGPDNSGVISKENKMKEEYLSVIRESTFTLCPTGSGPNSIRIYESLSLGSIPVILTKELHLPGPQELWADACIIEEDSKDGYRYSMVKMREMKMQQIISKRTAIRKLLKEVGPSAFGDIICKQMSE